MWLIHNITYRNQPPCFYRSHQIHHNTSRSFSPKVHKPRDLLLPTCEALLALLELRLLASLPLFLLPHYQRVLVSLFYYVSRILHSNFPLIYLLSALQSALLRFPIFDKPTSTYKCEYHGRLLPEL